MLGAYTGHRLSGQATAVAFEKDKFQDQEDTAASTLDLATNSCLSCSAGPDLCGTYQDVQTGMPCYVVSKVVCISL